MSTVPEPAEEIDSGGRGDGVQSTLGAGERVPEWWPRVYQGFDEPVVRKSTQSSRSLHRPDPTADEPLPKCSQRGETLDGDAHWRVVEAGRYLPFGSWERCTHAECYGGECDET